MRIVVVSDIHGNIDALQAVLTDAGEYDAVWCLGDLTGYGPNPNECVALIKEQPNLICIQGNHDVAALRKIDISTFNHEARESMNWLQTVVDNGTLAFLKTLPEKVENPPVTLAHGSPRNPIWEYILDPSVARANFDFFSTDYCFVGHTHQPMVISFREKNRRLEWYRPTTNETIALSARMILNPGSVGQPRDYDPRAAYAIFDNEKLTWELKRVQYDVKAVQKKIVANNLPLRHADRLAEGW